jgi:hypothetical protein
MADPFAPWRAGFAFWTMMAEAQTVMAVRTLGLWGVLPASPGENRRMVAEKGPAFARAAVAAGLAAAAGKPPLAVAEAALAPIGRKTRANARRLTRPKR